MLDFWMHFLCNMARFLVPKIIEKPKHTDSKRHHKIDQFRDRFFIDFCCVLEAKLDPCWSPFSAQDGPRGLQDGLRTPPRRYQERLKIQYNLGSRPKPGYPISPGDLGSIFDRFLLHFWTIFGGFLVPFLIDFYPKPPPRSARRRNMRVKW